MEWKEFVYGILTVIIGSSILMAVIKKKAIYLGEAISILGTAFCMKFFGQASGTKLWNVFEKCSFIPFVESLIEGLRKHGPNGNT